MHRKKHAAGIVACVPCKKIEPNPTMDLVTGTILVAPLTTPAWTQLFAHAIGLVTDMGSILAHGSIVCREYGIPGVLGVGNGTKRIQHGQTITIDGDAGIVMIHDQDDQFVPTGEGFSDSAANNPHVAHVAGGGSTGKTRGEAE